MQFDTDGTNISNRVLSNQKNSISQIRNLFYIEVSNKG